MRRNDDRNNYEDRITLYYYANAPVVQGSLIAYRNKIYILVNRETEENHCYYKSSAIACNGMIYKADNIYYKDGILHIIAEVTTNQMPVEHLAVMIDGLTKESYMAGDTVQLSATLYINNAVQMEA